jgi:hypothetical protein
MRLRETIQATAAVGVFSFLEFCFVGGLGNLVASTLFVTLAGLSWLATEEII